MNAVVAEYFSLGWKLCKVQGRTAKEPKDSKAAIHSWRKEYVSSPEELGDWPDVALVHEVSGTACLDIDDPKTAIPWLEAEGLKEAAFSGWVWQGDPKRFKVLFSVPEPLPSKGLTHGIEWRCEGRYDVLPPSWHGPSGRPYRWIRRTGDAPPALPEKLRAVWETLAKPTTPVSDPLNEAAKVEREYREDYDFDLIERECLAIRAASESPTQVSYDVWLAVASIAAHCRDGEAKFHAFSAKDPARYSQSAAQAKFEEARANMKPRTCAGWPDQTACAECRYKGQIASPLHIELALEKVPPEGLPKLPEGYFWKDRKVMAKSIDKEGNPVNVMLFPFPVYVEGAAYTQDTQQKSVALIHVDGVSHRVPISALAEREIFDTLCNIRAPFDPRPDVIKLVRRYLILSFIRFVYNKEEVMLYKHFAWQGENNDSFLLGEHLLRPHKAPQVVPIDPPLQRFKFTRRGTLEGWATAARLMFRDGYEDQAFTLLMGLASPLVKVLDGKQEHGLLLSLYSTDSGQGKSTVQRAVGTAFGDYRTFISQEHDTFNARVIMMSMLHGLPLLGEEFSTVKEEDIERLLYITSSGSDRSRGSKDGGLQEQREPFYLFTIISSNRSIIDMITSSHLNAAVYRCLELRMKLPQGAAYKDGDAMIRGMDANCGLAAPYIIQHILDNPKPWEDTYKVFLDELLECTNPARTELRFRVKAIAMMLTMAKFCETDPILSKMGVRTERMRQHAIEVLLANDVAESDAKTSSLDLLRHYINNNIANINIIGYQKGSKGIIQSLKPPMPGNPVYGRVDLHTNTAYLAVTPFKKWIRDNKKDWNTFVTEIALLGIMPKTKNTRAVQLSSYTPENTGVIEHCFVLRWDKVAMVLHPVETHAAHEELAATEGELPPLPLILGQTAP